MCPLSPIDFGFTCCCNDASTNPLGSPTRLWDYRGRLGINPRDGMELNALLMFFHAIPKADDVEDGESFKGEGQEEGDEEDRPMAEEDGTDGEAEKAAVLKIAARVDSEEDPQYPDACFPDHWYEKVPIIKGNDQSPFWQGWAMLRLKTFRLIENKYFETAVIIMILLSSLALVKIYII